MAVTVADLLIKPLQDKWKLRKGGWVGVVWEPSKLRCLASTHSPAPRVTLGPAERRVVPEALLEELHALDAKFEAREQLLLRGARLDRERCRFQAALGQREWGSYTRRRWRRGGAEWRASRTEACPFNIQGRRVVVAAIGGEVVSTVAMLCGREPTSALAIAARAVCRGGEECESAVAATAADDDIDAASIEPARAQPEPRLEIDRDAAVTQRVVDWLRDGPARLFTAAAGAYADGSRG